MDVLYVPLFFIFGVSIGSFLNVLIDRIPHDENPLSGRSYCDNCRKILKWYDLIPVVSFIFLGGKCRYCRKHVSCYYPLVEIVTGIMFVLTFAYVYGLQPTAYGMQFSILLYYLFIVSSLIVIFFADLKYGVIPDKILFPAILVSFPYLILNTSYIIPNLLSGLGAFLFFLFLHAITKGKGMGLGDVKFVFLLGLLLGFPHSITALYIAFLTGAGIGIILIIWRKKKLSGSIIPFGPFLVLGTLVSLFFGPQILQMASRLLNF